MVTPARLWSLLVTASLLALLTAAPATAAQEDDLQQCAVTGYLVESKQELAALRGQLAEQPVQLLDGVPLASGQTWVLPDGSQPVVMLDRAGVPVAAGIVSVTVAGQQFEVDSFDEPDQRYVTGVWLPHLGPTTRTLGLTVASPSCEVALTLSVDRSVWSTMVGAGAVAAAVLFGLLTVLVARLRKGGWPRRFLFAAPLGLVAGAAQGVVLLESGAVGPFATPPWWAPVAGLALAALLPLTRWRWRRQAVVVPPPPPAEMPTVAQQAPLGGYQVTGPFTATEVAGVYRAANEAGDQALLKLLRPERYGEPAARLRLEREARALSGWEHPNVLRLRETVSERAGPPTLVFEDVAGAPLRQLLLSGGSLSGPQAVNVVLGVLSGLRAVHERELVHRDVRPEHVWLDTGGRVLLAGFELASTGVEHPVAPEGVPPYASPEQRAGKVLDGRSDLFGCGMLLAELLTGRPAMPMPAVLPQPLFAVLARALAEDPAGRPASARQFSSELWDAAEQVYGPDWVGRGALAGALVAHGAVGAAVAGYAFGGAAGAGAVGTTAAGIGAATGTAAGTATAEAGLGRTGSASAVDAATSAGEVSAAAAAPAAPVAPAAGGATVSGGPVGAVVNAGVAVVAGIAVVAGAALVDPDPAEARSVVITPDQAHVIFVQTMAEGWAESFAHFADDAAATFEFFVELHESLDEAELTSVAVGVPPEQYAFPAWFVASALVPYEEGTVSLSARFERGTADEPWLMTVLDAYNDRLLPAPLVDDEGWLTPVPTDLLVDPASLPDRYLAWLARVEQEGELGTDEVLTLRFEGGGVIPLVAESPIRYSGDNPEDVTTEYELSTDGEVSEPVPLADGTVQVRFTALVSWSTEYRSGIGGVCDDLWLVWEESEGPSGRFRVGSAEWVVTVDAWIPVLSRVPDAPATPSPSPLPSPSPSPSPEPEAEPVDPDKVVIEDWRYTQQNAGGERC